MIVSRHYKCRRCNTKVASTFLPLDMLGGAWWDMVPEVNPTGGYIPLCDACFKVARTREGRIMGYTTVRGKTRQHVIEELFGEDLQSLSH